MVTFAISCVKKATNTQQLSIVYFCRMSKVIANVIFAAALIFGLLPLNSAEPASARVLVVEHPSATQAFNPHAEIVQTMVREGILRFTGAENEISAWKNLASTQDVIGIKVHSAPGAMSGTRPAVVGALIESMLRSGIAKERIVIWDRRYIDLRLAGYDRLGEKYGVAVEGAQDTGYDEKVFYPTPLLGKLVYGDVDFGKKGEGVGRNSFVTKLLTTRITKIINVTPLLNHNQAGVSGALFSLALGSVDNTLRFEDSERLGTALPEIYAMPELADRVVLNIVDALVCQYRGEERVYSHYSAVLNELWFSKDPVALDMLGIQAIDRFRDDRKTSKATLQIYSNAALMDLGIAETNRIRTERLRLGANSPAAIN